MPQFVLSNFPEKLSHEAQIHLEELQGVLLSQAKQIELLIGSEYIINIISDEDVDPASSTNIILEFPLSKTAKKRRFQSSKLNKFIKRFSFYKESEHPKSLKRSIDSCETNQTDLEFFTNNKPRKDNQRN